MRLFNYHYKHHVTIYNAAFVLITQFHLHGPKQQFCYQYTLRWPTLLSRNKLQVAVAKRRGRHSRSTPTLVEHELFIFLLEGKKERAGLSDIEQRYVTCLECVWSWCESFSNGHQTGTYFARAYGICVFCRIHHGCWICV